jgi:hypothetical protein
MGEHSAKRSATPASADYDFIKAYFELKRLREDIADIERSSKRSAKRLSARKRDAARGDDGVRGMLRP